MPRPGSDAHNAAVAFTQVEHRRRTIDAIMPSTSQPPASPECRTAEHIPPVASGRRRFLTLGASLPLAACSSLQTTAPEPPPPVSGRSIPPFSINPPGDVVPAGWRTWTLHRTKRPTRYQLVSDGGTTILQADADRSASGLITRVSVDLAPETTLSWRWRVRSLIDDADPTISARDDAPVRIALAFEGDHSRLSVRDRMFAERVKLLAGHELPYATLMYIWTNAAPVGAQLPNQHTGRIRKLVVDSGSTDLGQWREHRRSVEADFRTVFGEAPGRLVAVALMTDTDNTGTQARGYYGDIILANAR